MAGRLSRTQTLLLCLALLVGAGVVGLKRTKSLRSGAGAIISPAPGPVAAGGGAATAPGSHLAEQRAVTKADPGGDRAPDDRAYDPQAIERMLSEALANPDMTDRRVLLCAVAEFLARFDPAQGRACLERVLRSGNGAAEADAYSFVREFAEKLGERDPQAVVKWSEDLPQFLQEPALQIAASRWAAADPAAAMTWALGIDDRGLMAAVIRAVDRQVATSGPRQASTEWVRRLAASPAGPEFSDVVARQWGRLDPVAAWEWVRDLPKPEDHDRGLLALCELLATTNPQQTLTVAAELPAGDLRNRVRDDAVARWSEREPAAAVAWIERQPEREELLRRTAHHIAGSWMKRDPEAARRWAEKAPLTPEARDYLHRTTLRPTERP
jgi:hypothetical protein